MALAGKARPLALLLIALILAPALYAMPDANAQALEPEINRLARQALADVKDPRERHYLRWLSGHTIEINASDIPWLVGKRVGVFCILAYYNGAWHSVAFVPYKDKAVLPVGPIARIIFGLVPEVERDTKIIVQLPKQPPEPVNPLKVTPPPARGATEWGWLNITSGGHTYPLLIAAHGIQIEETCGYVPSLYSDNAVKIGDAIILGGGGAFLLEYAIKSGYQLTPELASMIYKNPPDLSYTVSPKFDRPLPDGGGGGGGDTDYVIWSSPIMIKDTVNGEEYWKEQKITITCDNNNDSFTFQTYIYPLSPSAGINIQNDVRIKSIVVYINGIPSPTTGSPIIAIMSGTMYLETNNYDSQKDYMLVGLTNPQRAGDDVVKFNISQEYPYGIYPTKISLTITGTCNGPVKWNITLSTSIIYKVDYTEKYFLKKFMYNTTYYLLYEANNRPLMTLFIPAGQKESDPQAGLIPISIPYGIAINLDKSGKASFIPLKIEIPPGFPGGVLGLYGLAGIYNTVFGIPSNPTTEPKYYYKYLFVHTYGDRSLLSMLLARPLKLAYMQVWTNEPVPNNMLIKVYIDHKNESLYRPFRLVALPILPVHHPEANYPNVSSKEVLLPIINHSYMLSESPLIYWSSADRLEIIQPLMSKISYYYRFGDLRLTVSHSSEIMFLALSLQPRDYQYHGNITLYGPGRIVEFDINLNILYNGEYNCDTSPEYYAYGISSTGNWDNELIRKAANLLGKISSTISKYRRIISILARVPVIIDIAMKTKSIVDVNVYGSCSGYTYNLHINAENSGWAPDAFENVIIFKFTQILKPKQNNCVTMYIEDLYIKTNKNFIVTLPVDSYWSHCCVGYKYR